MRRTAFRRFLRNKEPEAKAVDWAWVQNEFSWRELGHALLAQECLQPNDTEFTASGDSACGTLLHH